ncbi:MFS transporter [Nonomuraea sp. AD125B]|uniref:MFS transporter n=1 Tax=Nonomuraea sp. AD125B TaxID=3242897 RepID=UPI003529A3F4
MTKPAPTDPPAGSSPTPALASRETVDAGGAGWHAGRYRWVVLASATFTQAASGFFVQGIGAMGVHLRDDLDLSTAQLGLLLSAAQLAPLAGLLVAGELLDRYDERWVVGAGACVVAASLAVGSLAPGYAALLLVLLVVGAGYSTVQPGGSKSVASWFDTSRRGLAMGIRQAGLPLGGVLAAAVLPALAASAGWRATLVVGAAVASLGAITFTAFCRRPPFPPTNPQTDTPNGMHAHAPTDIHPHADTQTQTPPHIHAHTSTDIHPHADTQTQTPSDLHAHTSTDIHAHADTHITHNHTHARTHAATEARAGTSTSGGGASTSGTSTGDGTSTSAGDLPPPSPEPRPGPRSSGRPGSRSRVPESSGRLRLLREPAMVRILVSGTSLVAVHSGIGALTVLHLHETASLAPGTAALVFVAVQAAGAAGRICLAAWSDRSRPGTSADRHRRFNRSDRYSSVLACLVAVIMGLVALTTPAGQSPVAASLLFVWLGFFGIGWYGPWVAHLAESAPPGRTGFALGSAMAVNQIAIILTPPALGLLKDVSHGFAPAWGLLAALSAVALALTLHSPTPRPRP